MSIVASLQKSTIESLQILFDRSFTEKDFQVNQTKPEFQGDYSIVMFSLVKTLKLSPEAIGQQLGDQLVKSYPGLFSAFNIIKGFLNLTIADIYWLNVLKENHNNTGYGKYLPTGKKVMVEYSSPNTNKPLHLGHLRNNFLGWSVAEILKDNGHTVLKSCIVNDRGIHICKSMIAWKKWANGESPGPGKKGDHLVGDYYVRFENELKKQAADLANRESEGDYAHYSNEQTLKVKELKKIKQDITAIVSDNEKNREKIARLDEELTELRRSATDIMKEARQMLFNWEAGNEEVMLLWKKMNGWVYDGFDVTYKKIGSDFDRTYYESNTYLLGKDIVQKGLDEKVFYRKPDGSVWINLTAEGLDEKLVLRKDGTSVYITQDIGLAQQKYEEYKIDKSIHVIADEQNYHMKVLQEICKKLGLPYADDIHHLSYGMVELPTGKMKSREGTVVDADDIVVEMEKVAAEKTAELGKVNDFTEAELKALYETIGLGALKFFLLRVDPKKRIIFNPEESIDFHGFTGPFIQFNHARIKSILRKQEVMNNPDTGNDFLPLEKELIVSLEKYPSVVSQAAAELNPSVIAIYVYHIAKTFSSLYSEHSIAKAETEQKKQLRLQLAGMTAHVIKNGMHLLGIQVPERM